MSHSVPHWCRAWAACLLLLAGGAASAEDTVLTRVREACGTEIDRLCSNITRGNGRVIACLYAHQDEISHRCDYVLFDAAAQLQEIMGAMSRLQQVCQPDIELLCGAVKQGEGRLMQCLREKQMALSAPCHDAFEKVGIEVN
jgi:Cysteine rich repeat